MRMFLQQLKSGDCKDSVPVHFAETLQSQDNKSNKNVSHLLKKSQLVQHTLALVGMKVFRFKAPLQLLHFRH